MHWSQQTPSSNNTREDSTHGHHQMVNTEIRLTIFFAAKDGEALYSQQKQDRELIVAQIMNSLLPNSDIHSQITIRQVKRPWKKGKHFLFQYVPFCVTVFLCFFALIAEEGFLVSTCYSLELCIQMLISFLFSFGFHFSSFHSFL